jgi:hypothetical protein
MSPRLSIEELEGKLRDAERHNRVDHHLEKTCEALLRRGAWVTVWNYALRCAANSAPTCEKPNPVVVREGQQGIKCASCGKKARLEIPDHWDPRSGRMYHEISFLRTHQGDRRLGAYAANIWRLLGPYSGKRFINGEWVNVTEHNLPTHVDTVPNPLPYWVVCARRALRKKTKRNDYSKLDWWNQFKRALTNFYSGSAHEVSPHKKEYGPFGSPWIMHCTQGWCISKETGSVMYSVQCPSLPRIIGKTNPMLDGAAEAAKKGRGW